jgi:hypothetical protein
MALRVKSQEKNLSGVALILNDNLDERVLYSIWNARRASRTGSFTEVDKKLIYP